MRLDIYLMDMGFVFSRNKAKELIENGEVFVNNSLCTKPSYDIKNDDSIKIDCDTFYVSRSAKKLELFLDEIGFDVEGLYALDIGSSTGGFCQVLLNRGIKEVSALDIGSNQLHNSLRKFKNIISLENTDIRYFNTNKRFDLITCDVSFISLIFVLDSIDRLAKEDIILLFKPQFEVGIDAKRDKKGVVKDNDAIFSAIKNFESLCKGLRWELKSKSSSKVLGKNGNKEYLYHYKKCR